MEHVFAFVRPADVQRIVTCWREAGSIARAAEICGVSEQTVHAVVRMWFVECCGAAAADVRRAA